MTFVHVGAFLFVMSTAIYAATGLVWCSFRAIDWYIRSPLARKMIPWALWCVGLGCFLFAISEPKS